MTTSSNNLQGILYTIIGTFFFALADFCIKGATNELEPGQVMVVVGLGCSIVFLTLMRFKGEAPSTSTFLEKPVLLRNCGEFVGTYFAFTALSLMSLSAVTAIVQTAPLMMILFAAIILKEKVATYRLIAVLIGFIGVLIMLFPEFDLDNFDQNSIYALLAVVGMSLRDIGGRMARPSISTLSLSFYSTVTVLLTGIVMLLISGGAKIPDLSTRLYLTGLIVTASLAFFFLTQSVRIAEISVLSPFRYTRLIFGMSLGIFVLNEEVSIYMFIGALITISAGLYICMRDRNPT